MPNPSLSLIIPALNEAAYLPRLLESISRTGTERLEVIVVDNGSTDRTAEIARAWGAKVVAGSVRGIGRARNAGAASAQAEILCFVDADTQVHPDTFRVLIRALSQPEVAGGATGVVPERWSPALRVLGAMVLPMRAFGIDSGVVFCRRDDFSAIGGYRADLLVGEDVDFLWRLRSHVSARGARLLRMQGVEAVTSTRKFDKHGHWRFLGTMARLAWYRAVSPQRFVRDVTRYWYEDRG